ncbi:MAG: hypothetical protein HY000_16400 [Planctomycetes bacterium]|nr:hypothetical protein [Planctomycetota bacterium]
MTFAIIGLGVQEILIVLLVGLCFAGLLAGVVVEIQRLREEFGKMKKR